MEGLAYSKQGNQFRIIIVMFYVFTARPKLRRGSFGAVEQFGLIETVSYFGLCVCARACMRVCVRACVCMCVRVCVCVCVRAQATLMKWERPSEPWCQ